MVLSSCCGGERAGTLYTLSTSTVCVFTVLPVTFTPTQAKIKKIVILSLFSVIERIFVILIGNMFESNNSYAGKKYKKLSELIKTLL